VRELFGGEKREHGGTGEWESDTDGIGMEVILPAEYHTRTHTHAKTCSHTRGREMMGHARKVKINSLHRTHTHTHTKHSHTI
jgi:hypothetical protein